MVILTTKQQQLTPGQKGNTGNKVAGGNGKNAVKGRSDVIEDRGSQIPTSSSQEPVISNSETGKQPNLIKIFDTGLNPESKQPGKAHVTQYFLTQY